MLATSSLLTISVAVLKIKLQHAAELMTVFRDFWANECKALLWTKSNAVLSRANTFYVYDIALSRRCTDIHVPAYAIISSMQTTDVLLITEVCT